MKYMDLPIEEAREECKKHILGKNHTGVLVDCDHCPLRRTRTDAKGKEHTLFCYFKLQQYLEDMVEEYEELRKEDIKYYKEGKEQA